MTDEGRSGREAEMTAMLLPLSLHQAGRATSQPYPDLHPRSRAPVRRASGIVTVRPVTGTGDTTGLGCR
jgi:hypothetical protein